jgi:acetylornithine deacetylase/succinyl-diaminopimelate desuccinylase-like protein
MVLRFVAGFLLLLFAQNETENQLARDIYKELIEIDTTDSAGNTTVAAEAMAARLKAAGFTESDIQVLSPDSRKGNLVVRYRGRGDRKPILLLAHLDVVDALRSDWSVDPFKLTETNGYFMGRGTSDDKAMAAAWVATFIRLRREGYVPDRDLILALTADEEADNSEFNGVNWLLKSHRELIEADFALNEGGESVIKDGKYLFNSVQPSEKVYQSFHLEVRSPGGHSSRPAKENAIYRLAEGLTRLSKYQFPSRLNEVTIGYFEKMSQIENGQTAVDMKALTKGHPDKGAIARLSTLPYENALLRTTCVATRVQAGHADNALPENARAIVNCRLFPGDSSEMVRATLARVLDDAAISVSPVSEAIRSDASPLRPDVMKPIEKVTSEMWPGVPVIPVMSTGATDGLFLRNAGIPTYGISGFFQDLNDMRAHGRDERLGVRQFYEGREFLYRLVKALSS